MTHVSFSRHSFPSLIFLFYFPYSRRYESSVSVENRLCAGRPKNRDSIPSKVKKFSLLRNVWTCCGSLWTSQQIEDRGSVRGLRRLQLEPEYSPSATAVVKPACGYKSTGTESFIEWCLIAHRHSAISSRRAGEEATKAAISPTISCHVPPSSLYPHENGVSHQTAFSEISHLSTHSNLG